MFDIAAVGRLWNLPSYNSTMPLDWLQRSNTVHRGGRLRAAGGLGGSQPNGNFVRIAAFDRNSVKGGFEPKPTPRKVINGGFALADEG